MIWTVLIASPARKQTAKFPAKDQARVAVAVAQMAENPFAGDVLKLEGEGDRWRRRVGSYRVFFSLVPSTHTVFVTAIVRRTSKTY